MESSGEARLRKSIQQFIGKFGKATADVVWKSDYIIEEKYNSVLISWNQELLKKMVSAKTFDIGIRDRKQIEDAVSQCEKQLNEFTLSGGVERMASYLVDDFYCIMEERYIIGDTKEDIRGIYKKCRPTAVPGYDMRVMNSKFLITLTIAKMLNTHSIEAVLTPRVPPDEVSIGDLFNFISMGKRQRSE